MEPTSREPVWMNKEKVHFNIYWKTHFENDFGSTHLNIQRYKDLQELINQYNILSSLRNTQ